MTLKKYRLSYLVIPLFGLLIVGISSCAYFNTYYNAKYYFKEGMKDNENREEGTRPQTANFQKSIDSAARLIEYYPDSKYRDDAILLMGKAYYEIQSYPRAKRKFEELLNLYPDSPLCYEARLYLGKTLIAMRQTEQGIALLNALWVEKDVPRQLRMESQRSQADYYFEQENYRQALLEYGKILKTEKDKRIKADIQYQIGECYFYLGEYQEAEQAYKKVLDEKPTRKRKFEAIFKQAVTLQKLNELDRALEICEELLNQDIYFNYYKDVYLAKAGILSELGRKEEAVELYEKIITLHPRTETSAEASYRLGQIYLEDLKDFAKAEEYLAKVRSEKAQSEFVEDAMKKVNDLKYVQNISFTIDSLTADIDTLEFQLQWIAEHPGGVVFDSAQIDTTIAVPSDTTEPSEEPSPPPETIQQTQPPTPPGMPPGLSQQQLQQAKAGGAGKLSGLEGMTAPGFPGVQGAPGAPHPTAPKEIRLKPLPTDSTAIYERMAADREALAGMRYRLGEHLWTRFNDPDTARVIMTELCGQTVNPDVQARALLALYHIIKDTSPDSTAPDSLLERVHRDFPGTDYDRWVRPRLGLEPLPEPVDSAAELFREAEDLWLVENSPESAIERYREVTRLWPDSEWGPKALYAAAWIQEHVLDDVSGALASYDSLIAWYPQSEYLNIAKNKVAPPPPELPDTTAGVEDTTGAEQVAAGFGEAPPGSGPPELIGGEEALRDVIHQNQLYPVVAAEAEIPGEVMVSFTVDAQGNLKDFRILREDPEGFDFGEMAIQALQAVRFKPGYQDGRYVEYPATQLVRFIP